MPYSPMICRVISTESYVLEIEEVILLLVSGGLILKLQGKLEINSESEYLGILREQDTQIS